jgi:hypothetical protein
MKNTGIPLFTAVALLLAASALRAPAATNSPWERTMVTLEATRKQYDYLQPWTTHMANARKNGVILGAHQILTTAEFLDDLTLVRVQRNGRGKWWTGELQWVDYFANLAMVTVPDTDFWTGLQPTTLVEQVPTQGSAQIVRWRNGQLESRKAEINRLNVKRGKLGYLDHLHLEVDSEINSAGWSEALVSGSQLIGVLCAHDGNICTALPAPFVRLVLEAKAKTPPRQLGYFDFVWQKAENPASLSYLKLPGEPRGVLVMDYISQAGKQHPLKPRDIILQIDGFDIDTEGDYVDPDYGNLMLENLATRDKWAGDEVHVTVWRDGKEQKITYPLAKVDYSAELVPQQVFDQPPEYLLVGGLLFEPLTEAYLRSWGGDWRRKAPFRLAYYEQEKATPERPARVILSLVLPDPFNLGFQDYRFLTVDQVNGQKISYLTDLVAALKKPSDGYHIIEFGLGESFRRMVIDASEAEAATQRVMQRYGLQKDFVIPTLANKNKDLLSEAK